MTVIRILTELDQDFEITADKTTDFTLALADARKLIPVNSSGAVSITVPLNASVAIPIGRPYYIRRVGTGIVTFLPEGAVDLRSVYGYRNLARQYSAVSLIKTATDVWYLDGDLA